MSESQRQGETRARSHHPYLILTAVWFALLLPQLFGQMFVSGDARVYRPYSEFSRERWVEHHERTHWNPFVYGGLPASVSLADQRPQYLPDVALDLYENLRPSRWIPQGAPLFALLLGMLAMAALAVALFGAGTAGMVWAGAAWGLMPHLLVPWAFGHDAQLVTCSLIPVVLLGVHRTVAAGTSRTACIPAAWLAAVLAVQVLTGHPQFVVYSGLLAIAFSIERVVTFRRFDRLALLAASALLGAATSMAVWWPAILYSAHSFRGGFGSGGVSLEEVSRYSLTFRELIQMAAPQAIGGQGATYWGGLTETDYPRYFGISVWALAIVGTWRVRARRGEAVLFLWIMTAAFILLAFGTRLGPLYGWLYDAVPFFSTFRVPSAGLIVSQLGLALLSARAFGASVEAPQKSDGRGKVRKGKKPGPSLRDRITALMAPASFTKAGALAVVGLALVLGPLAGTYAGWMTAARPDRAADVAARAATLAGWDLVFRAALLAAAIVVWKLLTDRGWSARARARAWLLPLAATLLIVVDLGSVSWPALRRATGSPEELAARPMPELARLAVEDHTVRVSSTRTIEADPTLTVAKRGGQEFFSNDWISWRARSLGGDHGALPDRWRIMGDLPRSYGAMAALGVVYMSAPGGQAWPEELFERVYDAPGEVVYRLRRALGRAYASRRVLAPGSDAAVVQAMMAGNFDARIIVYAADPAAAGVYPGSDACVITWVADDPDYIALDVAADSAAFVVLADTHFPGWTASIDGRDVPLHRVNQLARGIAVPAGSHRVEMRYIPEGWRQGVAVTRSLLVAWLLALGAAAVAWSTRRSRRPSG